MLFGSPSEGEETKAERTFMSPFDVYVYALTLACAVSIFSQQKLSIPLSITLSLVGLAISLVFHGIIFFADSEDVVRSAIDTILNSSDFPDMVLRYMLGLLLFAGCLTADVSDLQSRWRDVMGLATVGVIISVGLVGTTIFLVFQSLHIYDGDNSVRSPSTIENFLMAFLFASIVSPTDPVAVLGILKTANASPNITTKVVGESLFNDVPGLACFQIFYNLYCTVSATHAQTDFHGLTLVREVLFEVVGGLFVGCLFGFTFQSLVKLQIGANNVVLLSVALTFDLLYLSNLEGSAHEWKISAPLSAVAAGLYIKRYGLPLLSDREHRMITIVWHFIEELLNAVLFLLIGFESLAIRINHIKVVTVAVAAIFCGLVGRFASVGIPIACLKWMKKRGWHTGPDILPGSIRILTWGGLRGGISIALVLSLGGNGKDPLLRELLLPMVYAVVLFSLLVQGLSLPRVMRCLLSSLHHEDTAHKMQDFGQLWWVRYQCFIDICCGNLQDHDDDYEEDGEKALARRNAETSMWADTTNASTDSLLPRSVHSRSMALSTHGPRSSMAPYDGGSGSMHGHGKRAHVPRSWAEYRTMERERTMQREGYEDSLVQQTSLVLNRSRSSLFLGNSRPFDGNSRPFSDGAGAASSQLSAGNLGGLSGNLAPGNLNGDSGALSSDGLQGGRRRLDSDRESSAGVDSFLGNVQTHSEPLLGQEASDHRNGSGSRQSSSRLRVGSGGGGQKSYELDSGGRSPQPLSHSQRMHEQLRNGKMSYRLP